ncbi:MAG: P1 family peptidase [bacterium]|nr:P1 family peptidase [bacterium]MDE0375024.1 P1 family peptidase [bacterium]
MNDSITAVPGVEVGHWTSEQHRTGVTVVVFPEPNVAATEIRGAAPGSRETALLDPGMRVQQVQALVFTGGSAFGLAAVDGVVRELAGDGRGHPTRNGPVPIVPAAVIYDLDRPSGFHPGAPEGALAYHCRSSAPVPQGRVGAGRGVTTSQWRGPAAVQPSGLGSARIEVGAATVGVLAVVNAVGDVFTLEGAPLTGGEMVPGPAASAVTPHANTTLVAVATDARLERNDLFRLCVRSQDAVAACIRPAHTRYDGDSAFAVSCGELMGDPDALGEAAFVATGRAIAAAVTSARPHDPDRTAAGP